MYNEENLALEAENTETQAVEETVGETVAEETVKTYTQEEFDAAMQKRLARHDAKLRREFEEKYSPYRDMEDVLNAGLGTNGIEEATDKMRDFYESKGVQIPKRAEYSEEDVKILADHEANKIIDFGYEAVVEEVDRLAKKEKMNEKEKIIFNRLASHRIKEQDKIDLAEIGIGESALNDKEYVEFSKNLNPNLSTKEKYELFQKYKPKPKNKQMGSMTNVSGQDEGVKDFYSYEEAVKFSKKDLDTIPGLADAIERSMSKW